MQSHITITNQAHTGCALLWDKHVHRLVSLNPQSGGEHTRRVHKAPDHSITCLDLSHLPSSTCRAAPEVTRGARGVAHANYVDDRRLPGLGAVRSDGVGEAGRSGHTAAALS